MHWMLFIHMGFQMGAEFYLNTMRFVWILTHKKANICWKLLSMAQNVNAIPVYLWNKFCVCVCVWRLVRCSAFCMKLFDANVLFCYTLVRIIPYTQSRQFRLYNNRFVATYILDISFRWLGYIFHTLHSHFASLPFFCMFFLIWNICCTIFFSLLFENSYLRRLISTIWYSISIAYK